LTRWLILFSEVMRYINLRFTYSLTCCDQLQEMSNAASRQSSLTTKTKEDCSGLQTTITDVRDKINHLETQVDQHYIKLFFMILLMYRNLVDKKLMLSFCLLTFLVKIGILVALFWEECSH